VTPPTNGSGPTAHAEEDALLALLIAEPSAGSVLMELIAGEPFRSSELQDLVGRVVEVVQREGGGSLERHIEQFKEEERPRLARLSMTASFSGGPSEIRSAVADCVLRINLRSCEAAMAAVEEQIAVTGSEQENSVRDGLLTEHRVLAQHRAALKMQLFQGRA
jgi:hypothetical protein